MAIILSEDYCEIKTGCGSLSLYNFQYKIPKDVVSVRQALDRPKRKKSCRCCQNL